MSLVITDLQRKALREVFDLVAKEGKIDKDGLEEIFKLIDYNITEKQSNELHNRLFNKKERIVFEDFLKIFNLKMVDYSATDVRNAFKLIAKDDDKYIPLSTLKGILEKSNMAEMDLVFLMNQLNPYTDNNGLINFQDFLKGLSL